MTPREDLLPQRVSSQWGNKTKTLVVTTTSEYIGCYKRCTKLVLQELENVVGEQRKTSRREESRYGF